MTGKSTAILIILMFLNSCKDVEVKNFKNAPEGKSTTQKKRKTKIEKIAFPLENILGIWSQNQDDPHADFEITKSHFELVDYDGNGEMQYEINDNKIKVYYPDSELVGLIKKAENDSLTIYWSSGNCLTYTRWAQ